MCYVSLSIQDKDEQWMNNIVFDPNIYLHNLYLNF